MEVSVVHAENVPEGCMLGLSAGGSRRQGPLFPQQKFTFGSSCATAAVAAGGTGLKVDLLKIAGSAKINASELLPGLNPRFQSAGGNSGVAGHAIEVPFPYSVDGGAVMTIGLSVRPSQQGGSREGNVGGDTSLREHSARSSSGSRYGGGQAQDGSEAGRSAARSERSGTILPAVTVAREGSFHFLEEQPIQRTVPGEQTPDGPHGARRHRLALQARDYLDDHSILPFLERALRLLVQERPADPWACFDSLLQESRTVTPIKPEKSSWQSGKPLGEPRFRERYNQPLFVVVVNFVMHGLDYNRMLAADGSRCPLCPNLMDCVKAVVASKAGVPVHSVSVEMGSSREGTACVATIHARGPADDVSAHQARLEADSNALQMDLEKEVRRRPGLAEALGEQPLRIEVVGASTRQRLDAAFDSSSGVARGPLQGVDDSALTATAAPSGPSLFSTGQPGLAHDSLEITDSLQWPVSPISEVVPGKNKTVHSEDREVAEQIVSNCVPLLEAGPSSCAETSPMISSSQSLVTAFQLTQLTPRAALDLPLPATPNTAITVSSGSRVHTRGYPTEIVQALPDAQQAVSSSQQAPEERPASSAVTVSSGSTSSGLLPDANPDLLRRQAREVILQSGRDGALPTILETAVSQQFDGEALRMKARGDLLVRSNGDSLKMTLAAVVAQQQLLQDASIREQARGIVGSMNLANACATPCVDCRSVQSQCLSGYPEVIASSAVLPLAPASLQQVNSLVGVSATPTAPDPAAEVRQADLGVILSNISGDVPLSEISTARFREARVTAEELVESMRLKLENEVLRQDLNMRLAQKVEVNPSVGSSAASAAPDAALEVRQVELSAVLANISGDVSLSEISTARFYEARSTAEELVENMRLESENEALRQELNIMLAQTVEVAPVGGGQ